MKSCLNVAVNVYVCVCCFCLMFGILFIIVLQSFKAYEKMTNQNAVASDRKSAIGVKITVTLSNSSFFSRAATKALPAPVRGGYITISRKKVARKPSDTEGGKKVNAWVDSMRDSSPTRVKSSASLSETAEHQTSWIVSVYSSPLEDCSVLYFSFKF